MAADYKFNLVGPDITAQDLASLCDHIPARRQLIVNTTSASGGSVAALEKPGRGVIAATKNGTEKNATVFARYWVEALQDPTADLDKSDSISAMEAFAYAQRKTAAFYESQKRLATEHPIFEDTGKNEPVREPSKSEGMLLASFPVLRIGAAQKQANDPAKQALLAKKEDLEQKIDALKYQKAAMDPADYKTAADGGAGATGASATGTGQMNWNEEIRCFAGDGAREYEPLPGPRPRIVVRLCANMARRLRRKPALSRWCAANSAYYRAEGYWGLEQYDQANEQFRIATAPAESDPLYKVRWGMLLHQRFNNTDAVGLFQEALQKDPKNAQAYLGLAIVSADGFDGKATDYVSRALVLDPKLVEAHEFVANLALEDADTEHAVAEADEALRSVPRRPERDGHPRCG